MKVQKIKPSHSDKRGEIIDILDHESVDATTLISFNRNSIRANHYHKLTTQWNYLISGEVLYVSKKINGIVNKYTMKPGDRIVSLPNEIHAIKGLKKSLLLVLTSGPRNGKDYESDTFRDIDPLLT